MKETLRYNLLKQKRFTDLSVELETNDDLWNEACAMFEGKLQESENELRVTSLVNYCKNKEDGEVFLESLEENLGINLIEFVQDRRETRHNPAGFDYEIIAQKKEYALIKMESTEEYKIVSDICADGSWAYTVCSWMYGKYGREEYLVMQNAIDSFRYKTESDYIPRSRLEELATQWKDTLLEECNMADEEQYEYFMNECAMDDAELEFFGLLKGDDE
jgi:hypothetical protein